MSKKKRRRRKKLFFSCQLMMIQTFHIAQPPVWKHSELKRGKRYFLATKYLISMLFFLKFFFQSCKVVFRNTPLKKIFFINSDFSLWGLPKRTFFPSFSSFCATSCLKVDILYLKTCTCTMINYLPAFFTLMISLYFKFFLLLFKKKEKNNVLFWMSPN